MEDESPLPMRSSVIQDGPSVILSSSQTAAPQHPHQVDAVHNDTEDGRADGGGVAASREEQLVCVQYNASSSVQTALASIEKTRKRRDDSSEGSESKRSRAEGDNGAAEQLASAAASHESVIKGPACTNTNAATIQNETDTSVRSLSTLAKEAVAVDSVNLDELEGACVNTRDVAVEDEQESVPVESSQLDSSQDLFGTPRAEARQEQSCAGTASNLAGSNSTCVADLPQVGSSSDQTGSIVTNDGDALPLEGSNSAQTGDSLRPQVVQTGSNGFGRRQHLAAKKRLASFQPRLSPVDRRSVPHRVAEGEQLLFPGPSIPPSSSSFTPVDALRRRRIAMPSPVMSRGARAVLFALTPSRTAVKGKAPNKSVSWTSPRHCKGSHNSILRVQSQFDTPVPRTPVSSLL